VNNRIIKTQIVSNKVEISKITNKIDKDHNNKAKAKIYQIDSNQFSYRNILFILRDCG